MKKPLKKIVFLTTFAVITFLLTANVFAQKPKDTTDEKSLTIPKVLQIDDIKIKSLLKPNGKPLLVNFWATWCIPCREEFPELVEIDNQYKDKIDFITISLDDLAEINRDVPKFLTEMKATMPTYLLRTNDENAVISSISKDWAGGLPFTILYNEKSEIVHTRQGKIKSDIVKGKIDELIFPQQSIQVTECIQILNDNTKEAIYYYKNNWMIFRGIAVEKNYIGGYSFSHLINNPKLLEILPDAIKANCDISLVTQYDNKDQYKKSEENFQEIIKQISPNGVKLLNDLKPAEFRKSIYVKEPK